MKEKIKNFAKKAWRFIINPRLLLCVAVAWMITNGWSYLLFALGTALGIGWMMAVGGAYLAFLWLPISPEKIVTAAISIFLLKWWFPHDKNTLGVLERGYERLRAALRSKGKEAKERSDKLEDNMKIIPVKTKYTYEKKRQTDFSYNTEIKRSSNIIEGRYLYRDGVELAKIKLCDGVGEASITEEQSRMLIAAGCFCAASDTQSDIRVTFYSESGESFCSAGYGCKCYFSLLDMSFVPVRVRVEGEGTQGVAICGASVLDPLGEWGGQSAFYEVEGGQLSDDGAKMTLRLNGRTKLFSPELPDSSDTVMNMLMPRRNTILFVLGNNSTAEYARLYFTTHEHPDESEDYVEVGLKSDGIPHAYYFNLSQSPRCSGRLKDFTLELNGEGEITVYRYSFEQEAPIWDAPLTIGECIANKDADSFTVRGIAESIADCRVGIYQTCMLDESDGAEGKTLICEGEIIDGRLTVENIPLTDNNNCGISRLSAQLVVFSESGQRLSERFYIQNYEVFDQNPYPFELPDYSVSVSDFGALGDAYHNDTDAIQAAIDHVHAHGGGKVIVEGSTDRYGKRYIVTNLLMRSLVELHICEGAVLWQSQIRRDYPYEVTYGHDGVVEGVNWTHNMHVSNLPLIQAENSHHIKITGGGKLRGMDIGSEEGVDMHMRYSSGCPDRIHLIMIGFFNVHQVECRDIEIVRCNNYHTAFYHSSEVYAANLKFHEVKCLSGDGIGIMIGTHDVCVNRCFVQSNDDYLVLVSVYNDPRGLLWWANDEGCHCGPYNITMRHSYVDAGTGGGVAFITWGTSDPVAERAEICNIRIYDNYFGGQKGIGGWFDNPYSGRVPFDNAELDDYSPVRDVRILKNRYTDYVTLGPVKATDLVSDCGLCSHSNFVNGDFSLGGLANWTAVRNNHPESVAVIESGCKEKGRISHFECGRVALCQGLYLGAGAYTLSCELDVGASGAELFVSDLLLGNDLHAVCIRKSHAKDVHMSFELDVAKNVYIGVRSADSDPNGFAVIDNCQVTKNK